MCDVSHPDALSGNATIPTNGGGRPTAPSGLVVVRHGPRRVPSEEYVGGSIGGGVRLVLQTAVFFRIDLETSPRGSHSSIAVSRNGLPLQTVKLAVVLPHPPPPDRNRLAPAGGVHANPASRVSKKTRPEHGRKCAGRNRSACRRLVAS